MSSLSDVGFFVAGFGLGVVLIYGYMRGLEIILDMYFDKKKKKKENENK